MEAHNKKQNVVAKTPEFVIEQTQTGDPDQPLVVAITHDDWRECNDSEMARPLAAIIMVENGKQIIANTHRCIYIDSLATGPLSWYGSSHGFFTPWRDSAMIRSPLPLPELKSLLIPSCTPVENKRLSDEFPWPFHRFFCWELLEMSMERAAQEIPDRFEELFSSMLASHGTSIADLPDSISRARALRDTIDYLASI